MNPAQPTPVQSAPEPLPVLEFFAPNIIAQQAPKEQLPCGFDSFATMDCADTPSRAQAREFVRRCNGWPALVAALEAMLVADDAVESANDFEGWADYPKPCLEQIDAQMAAEKLCFSAKAAARAALAAAQPCAGEDDCGISGIIVKDCEEKP